MFNVNKSFEKFSIGANFELKRLGLSHVRRLKGRATFEGALYPIREKKFKDGTIALNYNQWDVCRDAVTKGKELGLPVYRFLEGPLVRRFGQEWYNELCTVADELSKEGII